MLLGANLDRPNRAETTSVIALLRECRNEEHAAETDDELDPQAIELQPFPMKFGPNPCNVGMMSSTAPQAFSVRQTSTHQRPAKVPPSGPVS